MAEQSLQAKSINRRNILRSAGALASVAAVGVAGQAIAKVAAFDPERFIRERKAMGFRDVLIIEADGSRIRWYQLPMHYSQEIDRKSGELNAEFLNAPNGRERLLDYMEAHCEIVRWEV